MQKAKQVTVQDPGREASERSDKSERPELSSPSTGLVSPPDVELSPSTNGSIKQRLVQNAFGPVHMRFHTICTKVTHIPLVRV